MPESENDELYNGKVRTSSLGPHLDTYHYTNPAVRTVIYVHQEFDTLEA